MFKNNEYYIGKILEDLDFISDHMKSVNITDLESNQLLQDSMMFRLIQISEKVKYLTDEYREEHFNIPWTDIYGLRNRIVRDYGNVDLGVIYDTLTKDIPDLKEILSKL